MLSKKGRELRYFEYSFPAKIRNTNEAILSQEEKNTIAYLSRRQYKPSQIAREVDRHRSTICRELACNRKAYDDGYRAKAITKDVGGAPDMDFIIQKHRCSLYSIFSKRNGAPKKSHIS
jgi:hypothetical protein